MNNSVNDPVSFIEIGCAANAADIIQPMIDEGLRGLFVDANQDILAKRKQSLAANPNSHHKHVYMCALIGPTNAIMPFYNANSPYSSCIADHVGGHIYADSKNPALTPEQRNVKEEDVEAFLMPALSLTTLLIWVNELSLPVLSIDCEGMDCRIIAATDFSKIKPIKISFEHGHSEQVFIGKGTNYNKAMAHLMQFGYAFAEQTTNDTLVKLIGAITQ